MNLPIADTHIHIWDFNRANYSWLEGNTSVLNRNYAIEEIENERKQAGITKGILVQAANNSEDTDWMLEVARTTGWIAGVVGWLPLTDPDVTAKALEKYSPDFYFKGVRHLIHDEPDAKWLLQPAVIESLQLLAKKNIPYDVVGVLPAHIETVLKIAEQVPDLKMVFDHLNQPPIASGERFGKWGELMKEAAKHPGFFCKISGLGLTAQKGNNWTADDIEPYAAFVLNTFGVHRCFCGGDWPVALLAGSYTYSWQQYKDILQRLLNVGEQQQVLYENAAAFYSF